VAVSGSFYLSGLWPPMAEAVRYLQAYCAYYNYEGEVTSGFRSFQEQTALYAQGRTQDEITRHVAKHGAGGAVTDAVAGQSAHNYGLAVDIEGRDSAAIHELAAAMGFQTVDWDPDHIEWPSWRSLVGR
jgi:LAS superfamily LD-carboxypeptidase LdcB